MARRAPAAPLLHTAALAFVLPAILGASAGALDAQLPLELRGGFNLSEFVGGEVADGASGDTRRGLDLGFGFTPLRMGPAAVAVEVYYRQKGAEGFSQLPGAGAAGGFEIGLDYVEIPVLLRVGIPLASSLGLYLQGGPAFAWRIDCGIHAASDGGQVTPDCDDIGGANLEATLRDYEQGVVGGAGLELRVPGGMGAVTLDSRFTRGLTRISEDEGSPRNQSISLMLGYSFTPLMGGMR